MAICSAESDVTDNVTPCSVTRRHLGVRQTPTMHQQHVVGNSLAAAMRFHVEDRQPTAVGRKSKGIETSPGIRPKSNLGRRVPYPWHVPTSPRGAGTPPPDGRARILASGAALIGQRGFEATKLDDVAAQANVSRALVYHYFPGKPALLTAIVQDEADRVLAATRPDPDLPPYEALRKTLNTYLDYVARADGATRIFYKPGRGVDPEIEAIVERNLTRQAERIAAGFSTTRAKAARLDLVIRGWLGAVVEVGDRWARERQLPKRAVVDMLTAMLAAAVESIGVAPPSKIRPSSAVHPS